MPLPYWLQPNVWDGDLSEDAKEELRALKAYRELFRDIPAHSPGFALLCAIAEAVSAGAQRLQTQGTGAGLLCHMLAQIKLSWELDDHEGAAKDTRAGSV